MHPASEAAPCDGRVPFRLQLGALFLFVVLTRLPFLTAGYGVEVDGWRVALAARHIAENGVYEVSRFPGYPLQELICALFWRGGPLALNGLTALLAASGCVFFAKIARHLGSRAPISAAIAVCFVPVFYISSVGAKDYIWAATALLASLWFVLQRRAVAAGIFLGVAIGCRLTSATMGLPLFVLLVAENGRIDWRRAVRFAFSSATVASLSFAPVIWRYGAGFLQFYPHDYPDLLTVLHRATVEVWGAVGLVSLAIVCVFGALRLRCLGLRAIAAGVACLLLLAQFMRLPDQPGYLLPFALIIVLVTSVLVPRRVCRIFAVAMLLSSVLTVRDWRLTAGPILQEDAQRRTTVAQIESFIHFAASLPGKNVIAVGAWAPQIEVLYPNLPPKLTCVYLLKRDELSSFREQGFAVWYLPAIRAFNLRVNGYDLAAEGAQDLRALHARVVAARQAP